MPENSSRQAFSKSHPLHILLKNLNFQQEAYGSLLSISVLVGSNAKVNIQEAKMLKVGMKLHLKINMVHLNF